MSDQQPRNWREAARHPVIDGELVDAPRSLAAEPARPRPELRCDTHPDWLDCQLSRPDCVPFASMPTRPAPAGGFNVTDRRRLSYPRLRPGELHT